jgi:penicillin-binding protein 1B
MQRMSRAPRLTHLFFFVAFAAYVVFVACSVYAFLLNRRISRELKDGRWRDATTIVSVASSRPRDVVKLYGVDWRTTPPLRLSDVPSHVANAFIAAEDVRFRSHPGIDPIGIARAALANVRAHGIAQGGSTIDQQIIKARYLSQERTWRRKITEVVLAVLLDARLSKDEILELYLNDVYLGHHGGVPILGVDEAARIYFGKSPARLRVDEAALIASIVRAPNRDNPRKRPDLVRARRDAILATMLDRKWIDQSQLDEARRHAVEFTGGEELPAAPFPYYLRAIRSEIVQREGIRTVLEGGLTIECEIDPNAQRSAERAVARNAGQLESRYSWIRKQSQQEPLQVALLSVDPRTGGIRALVGGSNYRRSSFDRTANMRRQPGSAFKTFAYLAAIASKKVTNVSLLLDAPLKIELSDDETWEPQNYDMGYRGRVTLRESFERSLNVPTVRLTQEVGVRRVIRTAKNFGFEEDFASIPALPLGVTEVTMRELTAAYTPFPNLGVRTEPYLIRRVRDRRGGTLFEHEPKRQRVVDAAPAYVMHTLLRGVVRRGTAARLKRYGLGYVAGKTGTTNDYRDAWFVGYTPDFVTTVWVGFDHGAPLRLSSAEAAIPVWGSYMRDVAHDRGELEPPPGVTFRNVDPETGMVWLDGCPGPVREVFLDGTAPTNHCPRGILGRIIRRVLFDADHFDEPAAITFDQFRRWTNEVDRNRKEVERGLGRLRELFE